MCTSKLPLARPCSSSNSLISSSSSSSLLLLLLLLLFFLLFFLPLPAPPCLLYSTASAL